jgi:hypothetical protein
VAAAARAAGGMSDAQVMGDLVVYLRPPGRAPPSLMTR